MSCDTSYVRKKKSFLSLSSFLSPSLWPLFDKKWPKNNGNGQKKSSDLTLTEDFYYCSRKTYSMKHWILMKEEKSSVLCVKKKCWKKVHKKSPLWYQTRMFWYFVITSATPKTVFVIFVCSEFIIVPPKHMSSPKSKICVPYLKII